MKKPLFCIIILLCLLFSVPVLQAASLELNPANISLSSAAQVFTVQVNIKNVNNLGGFQFSINYPPSVVTIANASHVTVGGFLGQTGATVSPLGPSINNTTGKMTFGAFSYGENAGVSGNGILANISFTVLSPASGTLELDNIQLADATDASAISADSVTNAVLSVYISPPIDPPSTPAYTVNFTVNGNGTINGNTNQIVYQGAGTESVSAVPNEGYRFTGWTGAYTGTDNPLIISSVNANMNIIANFEPVAHPPEYLLTFAVSEHGRIEGEMEQRIAQGNNSLPVTAVPDEGYRFTNWTGDYNGTENPLIISNVNANMNIVANFKQIEDVIILPEYVLTFDVSGNGRIEGETQQTVTQGKNASSVTAIPDEGYEFSGWTGDYTGKENPLILNNIQSNMHITAQFVPSNGGVESVSILPEEMLFDSNTHDFWVEVAIKEVSSLGGFQFDMRFDPAIIQAQQAVLGDFFSDSAYTVSQLGPSIDNASGKITFGAFILNAENPPSGSGILAKISFKVIQKTDSTLNLENIQIAAPDGSALSVDKIGNALFSFSKSSYIITFQTSGNGNLEGELYQTVSEGNDSTAVTAVPDAGYFFSGWSGDYTGNENPLTVKNVISDMNITAKFEQEIPPDVDDDSDNDGAKDTEDEYPDDPSKATVMSYNGSGKISILLDTETNPDLVLSNVTALSDFHEALNPEGKPADGEFTDGMVVFTVKGFSTGEKVKVTLIFPTVSSLQKKFYMTDGQGFYEQEAQITDSTVVITLTDGGSGDADHTENGEILAAGGLVFYENSTEHSVSGGGGGGSCFISSSVDSDGWKMIYVFLIPLFVCVVCEGIGNYPGSVQTKSAHPCLKRGLITAMQTKQRA